MGNYMKHFIHLLFGVAITFIASTYALATSLEESKKEIETALSLEANIKKGKEIYRNCALCHSPEGWGNPIGRFPQIAGQHPKVIIKQLADIRAKNRDNPTMYPFTQSAYLKGAQGMIDVATYISKLPMVPNNALGKGDDLVKGEKLYKKNCVKCHGENGEGDNEEYYPRIQGQHYAYLLRQLHWIKQGKRRNADKKMTKQIHSFTDSDLAAVADYASRLKPDKKLIADHKDWRNPDFSNKFISAPQVQKELNDMQ